MRRFLPLLLLSALTTVAFAQQRGATIVAIAPTFGAPGTTVSIRGSGFTGFEKGSHWVRELANEPPPGIVEFNGVPGDVLFWQDDLITVKVPKHASTGVIRLILPESRIVLTGDVFDVYYSTEDESPAHRSESLQIERPPTYSDRTNESRERPLFFDEQAPPGLQVYSNPLYSKPLYWNSLYWNSLYWNSWFSSLSPGERTFLGENGFLFGTPFSLGRSGFLQQRGIRGRSGFDPLRSDELLFPDFSFRGSRNFGVRPFWFFFNTNHPSFFRTLGRKQGRDAGHIFRR